MRSMLTWKSMTLRPKKHRKGAIFHGKMCGFEVFQDFVSTECGEIRGIMGAKFLLTPASCNKKENLRKSISQQGDGSKCVEKGAEILYTDS